jgi:hypothetical protein
MGLVFHSKEEEPLMMETVVAINHVLGEAQMRGLSLPGALNVVAHTLTSILVSSYSSPETRMRVASSVPDLVKAYVPQWEKIIANARPTPAIASGEEGDGT